MGEQRLPLRQLKPPCLSSSGSYPGDGRSRKSNQVSAGHYGIHAPDQELLRGLAITF